MSRGTVPSRRVEKLRGSKLVVPADRNPGWGYLFLTTFFQIHHCDPATCKDPHCPGKLFSLQRRAQYLDSGVKSWATPRPTNTSFLPQPLLNILWGKILQTWFTPHIIALHISTEVQFSPVSCCPEVCLQLKASAGQWWYQCGHTDIPLPKGMQPTQHQQTSTFCW